VAWEAVLAALPLLRGAASLKQLAELRERFVEARAIYLHSPAVPHPSRQRAHARIGLMSPRASSLCRD
jgi:hypothetical protein